MRMRYKRNKVLDRVYVFEPYFKKVSGYEFLPIRKFENYMNPETRSLSKEHTSIVLIDLEIEKEQIVKAYAYDETADWVYRGIKKGDFIVIQGSTGDKKIEILLETYKEIQYNKRKVHCKAQNTKEWSRENARFIN